MVEDSSAAMDYVLDYALWAVTPEGNTQVAHADLFGAHSRFRLLMVL